MSAKDLKLDLIQRLLQIQDFEQLKMLDKIFNATFESNNKLKNEEVEDDYIHPKGVPFDSWIKQFNDKEKLNDLLPEHGMTLLEFRKQIWEAEHSEGMSYDKYLEKTKNWFK